MLGSTRPIYPVDWSLVHRANSSMPQPTIVPAPSFYPLSSHALRNRFSSKLAFDADKPGIKAFTTRWIPTSSAVVSASLLAARIAAAIISKSFRVICFPSDKFVRCSLALVTVWVVGPHPSMVWTNRTLTRNTRFGDMGFASRYLALWSTPHISQWLRHSLLQSFCFFIPTGQVFVSVHLSSHRHKADTHCIQHRSINRNRRNSRCGWDS